MMKIGFQPRTGSNAATGAHPAQRRAIARRRSGVPQRSHREAMARTDPPHKLAIRTLGSSRRDWHDDHWHHEHDEAGSHRARMLLSRPVPASTGSATDLRAAGRWLGGGPWMKRIGLAAAGLVCLIFAVCFGGLWLRLGAGPIGLDIATPWLAAAIEDNIGNGNTVEVGGTQIERAGRIRIAVRIRDVVVRDRDQVIVATAPKAEVRLSGIGAADGPAAGGKPEAGGRRTRHPDHAGWSGHGLDRRHARVRSPPASHRRRRPVRARDRRRSSSPLGRRLRDRQRHRAPRLTARRRFPACWPASIGSTA